MLLISPDSSRPTDNVRVDLPTVHSRKENTMSARPVFAEQAEQFTMVVGALLQNEQTRSAFVKEPLATLRTYGIDFSDPAMAKKVEAELATLLRSTSMPNPDDPWPPRLFVRAVSITWVAKEDLNAVINVDRVRVDAFVSQAAMQAKVNELEKKIVVLEKALARA